MADLAGPCNQKGEQNKEEKRDTPPPHPKPHRRRDTLSQKRRNVRNHSCVPFNQEDVMEKPERNQKPTMVHPENSCNGKLWYSNINRHVQKILSKIRSNLTWHSNMLKTKYLPEKAPQKSRNRRSRRTSTGDD